MFIFAHLAAGLIVGKVLNNYPAALIGALAIDIDHLIPYVKHKVIFSAKKFWKTVTNQKDPYGNQRNFLHSFFTWTLASFILVFIDSGVGIAVSVGYLSHLLLDMLDGSDFYPFYPYKFNVKGPIEYFSKSEIVFTAAIFLVFFLI